jgi:glycerophosphoryl diester phosphodiesterase
VFEDITYSGGPMKTLVAISILLSLLTQPTTASAAGCDDSQPRVIAHRGYHNGNGVTVHSNTLRSFALAAERGYDVETDVRADAEGVLWIMHDADVFADTGVRGLIAEMTTAEVAALRTRGSQQRIPRLSDALAAVRDGSPTARVYVETKIAPIAAETARQIRNAGMADRAYVTSRIGSMRAADPGIRLLLKSYRELAEPSEVLQRGASIVAFRPTQISPELVATYRRAGLEVQVGLTNIESEWRAAVDSDVDAIVTDLPDDVSNLCVATNGG